MDPCGAAAETEIDIGQRDRRLAQHLALAHGAADLWAMTSMAREVLTWLLSWLHWPRLHRDMGPALGPRHDRGARPRRAALFAAALAILMVPLMTGVPA